MWQSLARVCAGIEGSPVSGPSAAKQPHELVGGQTRIGNDSSQSALPDLFVIWNHDRCMGFTTAKDHVAAALAAEYESRTLQSGPYFSARKVSRKFGHGRPCSCGIDLDELLADLGGDRVAGVAAVGYIKRDCVLDVA